MLRAFSRGRTAARFPLLTPPPPRSRFFSAPAPPPSASRPKAKLALGKRFAAYVLPVAGGTLAFILYMGYRALYSAGL